MLSIGNKKYRNLQEQVGYNTECIKKLGEYLDGIRVEDKLVVIESDSGTFTGEELVVLGGPLAFISNEDKVWIKVSETDSQFVYKAIDIEASEIGNAYFNVGGSKIVVNRGDGSYNTSSDTIITTYSKSQVDSIIANINAIKADKAELTLKANVSGQAFTGAITAPSIIEDMSGYSFYTEGNLTEESVIYAGVCKNGNKISFVLFGTYTKKSENPTVNPILGYFIIPSSVGEKLRPYSSNTLLDLNIEYSPGVSSQKITLPGNFIKRSGTLLAVGAYMVHESGANRLVAGTPYLFRIEATFLLSDNLAS